MYIPPRSSVTPKDTQPTRSGSANHVENRGAKITTHAKGVGGTATLSSERWKEVKKKYPLGDHLLLSVAARRYLPSEEAAMDMTVNETCVSQSFSFKLT